jgi:CDP-diacylglycerol--serine O-phosphatidyltransferase
LKRPGLVWVPNAFTAMNVLLGFLSILVSVSAFLKNEVTPMGGISPYDTACWLILWATLFDVLDGKIAKLTGTTSDFGMRLDTFADAVTFGLAPAVLIFCTFLSPARLAPPLGWIACGIYFSAAIFRLARYNVISSGEAPSFGFKGLPTPASAMIGVSLYLSTNDAPPSAWLIAIFVVLLGVVMVSPLTYPAFKGTYPREKRVIVVILAMMAVGTIFVGPANVLFYTWSSFALIWGWLWIPTRALWVPELMEQKGRRHA